MELFRITCVTCQARLSVRDRSAIGQIIACPRCGSMVQVTAPEEPAENEASEPASEAIELNAEPAGGLLGSKAVVGSLVTLAAFGLFVVGWILTQGDTPAESEADGSQAATASQSDALGNPADTEVGNVESPVEVPENDLPSTDDPASLESDDTEPADAERAEVPETHGAVPPPDDLAPSTTKALPAETAEAEGAEPRTNSAVATLDDSSSVPKPLRNKPQGRPTSFDPLDIDPEGFDLASLSSSRPRPAVQPPAGSESSDVSENPGGTPAFGSDEKDETDEPDRPDDAGEPAPSSTQVVRFGPEQAAVADLPLAEEQLTQTFPAIEIDGLPLCEFLVLVSQWGGVPVSLAPEQLQLAAISTDAPVTIRQTDATLAQVLREALEPLRLDFRTEGPAVILYRPGLDELREIDYPVDDLVTAEIRPPSWPIGPSGSWPPDTWQTAGGDGLLRVDGQTLHVEQPEHVQYQVLCFLERLRLARDLKPRSSYPPGRLALLSADSRPTTKLDARTTFTFTRYTPLEEIFAYWQQQLGVAVLVDWPSLLAEGVSPRLQIACAVKGEPWHQALDTVLDPLGLGWRPVDKDTIEITTSQVIHEQPQLKFYSLDTYNKQADEPTLTQAKKWLDKHRTSTADGPAAALLIDPPSNTLIANQPTAAHRRLEQWLSGQ